MANITKETLHRYSMSLYNALKKDASKGVWEGGIIKLFSGLGISNAHYGRVLGYMYDSGSIEQLQRGSRGNPTRIKLNHPPRKTDLETAATGLTNRLTTPSIYDSLEARLNTLERRLEGIDIAQYIAHNESRLKKLEQRLSR